MDAFPAFVPLAGVRVAVAGEGEAAEAKARLFAGSPATLLRLSPAEALAPAAWAGVRLGFVAGEADWARAAAEVARGAGAWVNVVDRPQLCDFNTPGIVDRGTVVGAVGTAGAAPVLAVRLRQEIETRWPAGLGELARLMAALRPAIREATPNWSARRRRLSALMSGPWAEAALLGDLTRAEALARMALAEGGLGEPAGAITLVAAPPASDLLTLRAARALGAADRLVLAGDVADAVLDLARRDAPRSDWDGDAAPLLAWSAAGEHVAVVGAVVSVATAVERAGADFAHA